MLSLLLVRCNAATVTSNDVAQTVTTVTSNDTAIVATCSGTSVGVVGNGTTIVACDQGRLVVIKMLHTDSHAYRHCQLSHLMVLLLHAQLPPIIKLSIVEIYHPQ